MARCRFSRRITVVAADWRSVRPAAPGVLRPIAQRSTRIPVACSRSHNEIESTVFGATRQRSKKHAARAGTGARGAKRLETPSEVHGPRLLGRSGGQDACL